jgi:predicted  nucleic acid-binding Zn-ribbon protein
MQRSQDEVLRLRQAIQVTEQSIASNTAVRAAQAEAASAKADSSAADERVQSLQRKVQRLTDELADERAQRESAQYALQRLQSVQVARRTTPAYDLDPLAWSRDCEGAYATAMCMGTS